jgi:NAD-dependent dihydropyrimidine dehydrogenase PreA subunit
MPNNVCNLFFLPLENEKKIKKYITKAERKMHSVCNDINNGVIKKRGFNIFSRILGLPQGIFMPLLEKKSLGSVKVADNCSLCHLCINNCPMYNLEYKDGKIIQKSNCTICYRCINRCPQKAVTIFSNEKIKEQYKGLQ